MKRSAALDPHVLAAALLATASPLVFAAAGEALASAILRGADAEATSLADVMARRLVDVRRAAILIDHGPTRVAIALAAAALAWARPDLDATCRKAITAFLAPLGPAGWTRSADEVAARAVLADAIGDGEESAIALRRSRERGEALASALVAFARESRGGRPLSRAALWAFAGRLPSSVPAGLLVATAWSGRSAAPSFQEVRAAS